MKAITSKDFKELLSNNSLNILYELENMIITEINKKQKGECNESL